MPTREIIRCADCGADATFHGCPNLSCPTRTCGPRTPLKLVNSVPSCAVCGDPPHDAGEDGVAEGARTQGLVAGVCYLLLGVGALLAWVMS